ncbi:MAG: hypothetical protein ACREXY_21755 [Gammaproteobacteria bacterium]
MNKPEARLFETPHGNPKEQRRPLTADNLQLLQLCAEAKALLETLSPQIRPHHLPGRFPRIMNQIAHLWRQPAQLGRYFEELLIDRREGRQGFPFAVVLELTTLKNYHQSEVYSKRDCIWQKS